MLPYTVKYDESEYDIQNNILLHKIHQQCQITFDFLFEDVGTFRNFSKHQDFIQLYL